MRTKTRRNILSILLASPIQPWVRSIFMGMITAVESVSNPYGRSCLVCGGPDRQAIDAALASGTPVSQLVQQFGCSRDSLYRHTKFHLRPALQQALQQSPEFRPAALVRRVADVADAARDARAQAYAGRNPALGARLGDAELRAIQVLVERFKIDHDDVADDLRDAAALALAVGELTRKFPPVGVRLADELDRADRPALADQLRQLAASSRTDSGNDSRQESTDAVQ